jgi:hypothetical protein
MALPHLLKEPDPAESAPTEQVVAFAGLGGPGWRCDFCGEIEWGSDRPPRPHRFSRCGHSGFTKTEHWEERVKLKRPPLGSSAKPEIYDNPPEPLRQELDDLRAALARQESPLDARTRGIAEAKIDKLQKQISKLAENRSPV